MRFIVRNYQLSPHGVHIHGPGRASSHSFSIKLTIVVKCIASYRLTSVEGPSAKRWRSLEPYLIMRKRERTF